MSKIIIVLSFSKSKNMAAELVAGALLSASLQVLFERLASEIPQLFRGKRAILDLLDELKVRILSANSLVNDAEEKQFGNKLVREWLFELQDVIYEADDLVNRIDLEALPSKLEEGESSSGASKVFMKLMPSLFSAFDNTVKRDATEILRRLKILLEQKDALGLREGVQSKTSQRPPAPLLEESDVYGRDADKKVIVNQLLSDDVSGTNKISVIPIVGMGGIGKTTLAQLVYDDERVQQHFQLKTWVTVSEEFDILTITKTILRVISDKDDCKDFPETQRSLKEALRGKKFLFVLDDVWNENYHLWDALKSTFESGADGSKIIVTTRSERVASIMAPGENHHLTNLSDEDSWRLFGRHAFGVNADPHAHQDLQVIGREIVNKCKGVPLAIKSIGGLLCSTQILRDWEKILNSDTWELYEKEGTILPALWLSYRHLPTHLKRCFAYCSIFPKDYPFERKEVILLWMAEGLLQSDKRSRKMEELGEEYFRDLLSRSLFQQSSQYSYKSKFLMHDLVNDLAMFVSGEFCSRLDWDTDLHSLSSKTRHLSYKKGTYDFNKFKALCKSKCLRTLLALPLSLSWSMHGNNLTGYHLLLIDGSCLRVLSFSESSIKELPDSIGNLKHLRYLDLSSTRLKELPDSICTLYYLQTLLLRKCENLSRLPKNMGRLINLRHLDIEGVPLEVMPLQISDMTHLQSISQVILGDRQSGPKIEELKGLEHLLETLVISGLENIVDATEASKANLKDNKRLSTLKLRWNADQSVVASSSQIEQQVLDALRPHTNLATLKIEFYRGTMFSDWLGDNSFSNLVSIWLKNCKNCWILPPLGQLPSLKYLRIEGLDSVVSLGDDVIHGNGPSPSFRSLEELWIENMLEWKAWSFSEAAIQEEGGIFPRLKSLELYNCPKLNVAFPGYLPSLESLHIWDCEEMGVLVPRTQQSINASSSLVEIEASTLLDWGSHSKVKQIRLWNCRNLLKNRMHWGLQRLSCLEFLQIIGWEDDSFPEEGLLPTTLTEMYIQESSNLKCLNGKAFQQLTSLTSLHIWNCKSLRCLPEEGLPTSLSELEIWGCPLLKQRCEKEGEDWPKIAHIAKVSVRDKLF